LIKAQIVYSQQVAKVNFETTFSIRVVLSLFRAKLVDVLSPVRSTCGQCPLLYDTTHWSVVLAAKGDDSPQGTGAIERLCL
jgi:hypothetical protein